MDVIVAVRLKIERNALFLGFFLGNEKEVLLIRS